MRRTRQSCNSVAIGEQDDSGSEQIQRKKLRLVAGTASDLQHSTKESLADQQLSDASAKPSWKDFLTHVTCALPWSSALKESKTPPQRNTQSLQQLVTPSTPCLLTENNLLMDLMEKQASNSYVAVLKNYATPVSAKPSLPTSDKDSLLSDDTSDDLSVPEDEILQCDVFGLRKGPRLKLPISKKEFLPSASLVMLLEKERLGLADRQYMQIRQNGHFKASKRLGKSYLETLFLIFF
jgi:hypothetical protein